MATQTTEASAIKVGDQVRDDFNKPFITVIERESFKRGTRIWLRLADGNERTFCAATTLTINRAEQVAL